MSLKSRLTSPKTLLETLTNVAIVTVSGIVLWSFVMRSDVWPHRAPHADGAIAVGAHIAPPPGYSWASHSRTLILAIREGCVYCKNSVPFYRRLSGLRERSQLRANFLAVMPDSQEVGAEFLTANNIGVDKVYSLPLSEIKVSGTPSLLLLDNKGQVEKVWVGQLPGNMEDAVLAAVRK